MLYYETILPSTLDLLRKIQSLDLFKETKLVGGTALALQIGHRTSVDLDFFGHIDATLDELTEELSAFSEVIPISASKSMRFLVVNGVKIDIVNYPYPWLDSSISDNGIVLAGIKDIAAMKLSAITNRGTKKDFVDLYFLLQKYTIEELISFYQTKYTRSSLFTVVKSLTYFDDAEGDAAPLMIKSFEWSKAKSEIIEKVNGFLNQ